MNRDILRQIVVVAATVAMLIVNVLANALPLNGQNTGEISDRFQIYFVPAGYVFSIWLLIYLALGAYTIYQALPSQRENPRLRSIGYVFVFSCLANIAWLFLWHYEVFELTLVAMVALLLSLIMIYLRLNIGRGEVPGAERWTVHLPFSIYLGWITVATIANATQLLDYLNWNGWGIQPEIWAVIMLAVGVLISVMMSLTRADIAYSLVLIWAIIGIALKQAGAPVVAASAWVSAGLIGLILVLAVTRKGLAK